MKKLIFTIAFGDSKYMRMAKALEKSVKKYNPEIEFKIFGEHDFTPYEIGLPKGRKVYPKDYKYPKIEIMSRLNDPDTQYMFIDSDAFVLGKIDHYFEFINKNSLIVEYIYNKNGSWAGRGDLRFSDRCTEMGFNNIEAYSLNSGFMMWQGGLRCFEEALRLIKTITLDDIKGRNGDEYYYCLASQLTNTQIIPLNYEKIKIGKYWDSSICIKNGQVLSSRYMANDRVIIHYGNSNYKNPYIQFVLNKIEEGSFNFNTNFYINSRLRILNIKYLCSNFLGKIYKRVFYGIKK